MEKQEKKYQIRLTTQHLYYTSHFRQLQPF
nr:MAG TPA: hypothetical protein [Caudoviricetes sp.]